MEFRVLGPLEVEGERGPIALPGPRERSLLIALLIRPNEVVAADRLIEELWPTGVPSSAPKMLQLYVSRLRKALGRDRLRTQAGGYAVAVDDEEHDAARFERLVAGGRAALARGDFETASERLRAALALWRGPALADVSYEQFAQSAIARLDELRLEAIEARIEADLGLGRADVAELEALVAEHPLREGLRGQLMVALYRTGRQAEALETFRAARLALVDELGIEPGPELRGIERRILEQDPSLGAVHVEAPPAAGETRKLVTAVFVDFELDPEVAAAREDDAAALLANHGAAVERAGGLAGYFGIPRIREDDAARAVRVAEQLRAPEARVEVVTGEALVGHGIVTGLRRERPAPLGEVAVSAATEDAIASPRRKDAPFVGRRSELHRLRREFERSVEDRTPSLVTIFGPAGIGKSRLARELAVAIVADVLWGRCLPPGEGNTYWPLREMLGADPRNELESLLADEPDGELAAARVADAVAGSPAGTEETFWAVRKSLEARARDRPLLLVVDDLHWAEPTMLELIEHVAALSRGAPLFLVCLARPDLLEERPSWGGGQPNAVSLTLAPLDDVATGELIDELGAALSADQRARVATAAEGNPLFVEQLLAMAGEADELRIPSTIHALLAARLDRLPAVERDVLATASVVGREFPRAAVDALREVDGHTVALDGLVRKDLVVPTRHGFRFRHQLIHDEAYRSLPKRLRAELHERLADWLHGEGSDESVGYHLEQAALYLAELGGDSADVGARGAALLAAAGRRALARGDVRAAAGLLRRAADLNVDVRPSVLPTLADALLSRGEFEQAAAAIDEALRSGDSRVTWRARLARVRVRLRTDVHVKTDELLEELGDAIEALAGDDAAIAQAWSARGWVYWLRCRAAETEQAALRAIAHASAAGDEWAESRARMFMLGTILFGPTPVEEGIARCREIYEGEHPLLVRATAARALGGLRAMAGAFDEARALLARDRAILDDLGLAIVASHAAEVAAMVELLAGDAAAAERVLRPAYEHMTAVGDVAAPTFAAILARAAAQLGRDDEALALSDASRAGAPEEDLTTQVQWRGPRAVVLARQGAAAEAETLAREAVELADRTDFLNLRADAYADLGAVTGDTAAAAHASALYEQKGNVAILAPGPDIGVTNAV